MRKFARLARLKPNRRRRAMMWLVRRALLDDRGSETLEYALVTGLIVTGAIGVINCVGTKLLARWQSLNSSL